MNVQRQIALMLVLDAAFCAFWVYYRMAIDVQYQPYLHFLVDYRFGLIRRALVGAIAGLFFPRVPILAVFVFGIIAVLLAVLLYLILFRKDFGFRRETMPLFAMVVGSPFFFKNFFYNLGYFDVLGCIVALCALLLPVNAFYPLLVVASCVALIFVHHIHFLLYVPTIIFITLVRQGTASGRFDPMRAAWAAALFLVPVAAFLLILAHGTPQVSEATFLAHMRARAIDPFNEQMADIWYRTMPHEFHDTIEELPHNLLQAPLYFLVLALHWPLIRFARASLDALGARLERLLAIGGLATITASYAVIFVMVYDYSRWFSSWAVCLWLTVHAVRRMPSAAANSLPPERPRNLLLAWLVSIVPRIGTVTPF